MSEQVNKQMSSTNLSLISPQIRNLIPTDVEEYLKTEQEQRKRNKFESKKKEFELEKKYFEEYSKKMRAHKKAVEMGLFKNNGKEFDKYINLKDFKKCPGKDYTYMTKIKFYFVTHAVETYSGITPETNGIKIARFSDGTYKIEEPLSNTVYKYEYQLDKLKKMEEDLKKMKEDLNKLE